MKSIVVGLILCGSVSGLLAGGVSSTTELPYPNQWSQPQVLQNGTIVPPVPTGFRTREVGVRFQPVASSGVSTSARTIITTNSAAVLIVPADGGDLPTTKALVAKGADVNAANSRGATALMAAAAGGRLDIVTFLLAKGADPNLVSASGKTALIYAAQNGHKEVVQVLLKSGADRKVMDETGKMAVDYAAAGSHTDCVTLLKAEVASEK